MNKKEFVEQVIKIYEDSRLVLLPDPSLSEPKLRRGRNHIVAGKLEDLFAYFLIKQFPQIEKIAIDQGMSLLSEQGASTKIIYPDLSIFYKHRIRIIIDVKTDLGRKRGELENLLIEASQMVQKMKNCEIRYRDGINKQIFLTSASRKLKAFVVIVSKQNIPIKLLENHLKKIRANLQITNTKVFFLTGGTHPNRAIYKSRIDRVEILEEFEDLLAAIKKEL